MPFISVFVIDFVKRTNQTTGYWAVSGVDQSNPGIAHTKLMVLYEWGQRFIFLLPPIFAISLFAKFPIFLNPKNIAFSTFLLLLVESCIELHSMLMLMFPRWIRLVLVSNWRSRSPCPTGLHCEPCKMDSFQHFVEPRSPLLIKFVVLVVYPPKIWTPSSTSKCNDRAVTIRSKLSLHPQFAG